jgi:restriction endonuclease
MNEHQMEQADKKRKEIKEVVSLMLARYGANMDRSSYISAAHEFHAALVQMIEKAEMGKDGKTGAVIALFHDLFGHTESPALCDKCGDLSNMLAVLERVEAREPE